MSATQEQSAAFQPVPDPGESASDPSGQPGCHEMSDNVTDFEIPEPDAVSEDTFSRGIGEDDFLTGRQRSALPVILASATIREAAKSLRISERTIYRWLEDEDFRKELARLREEIDDLACQELRSLSLRIVSVYAEGMAAPDLATRIRSARYAAAYSAQVIEARQLRKDIESLEQAFEEMKAKNPVR